jgi:hypothetical protein
MRTLRVLAVVAALGWLAGCAAERISPSGTVTSSSYDDRRIEQINSPGGGPASPTQTPGR